MEISGTTRNGLHVDFTLYGNIHSYVQLLVASLKPGQAVDEGNFENANTRRYSAALEAGQVYVGAQLEYDAFIPQFTLGDGNTYDGYFNGPLQPGQWYACALRAVVKSQQQAI